MPERHFRNHKLATSSRSSNKAPESPNNDQQWDTETCTNVVRQLLQKCLDHYEGGGSGSSSAAATKQSSKSSLGTLYCGPLSARVYLRLRMAQYLKVLGSSSDSNNKTEEIQALLNTGAKIAEEAVEIEVERMERHRPRVTLLEGPFVGAKCMLAALYHQLGQGGRSKKEAEDILEFLREQTTANELDANECEVLYGRAGALMAIFFLRQELGEEELGSELVVTLAQQIVAQGLLTATAQKDKNMSLPLLWEWHGKHYLGAAHGVVGILHTLLCLRKSEMDQIICTTKTSKVSKAQDLALLLKESVHALDAYCWAESGNLKSSIQSSSSGDDKLVHWCHGAPGHVLLLVKAHEVFHEEQFLLKARKIGKNVIWPRGLLRKGVGLCHGIAGNAYSLLALGRGPKNRNGDDGVWMRHACYFATFSLENWSSLEAVPDRPYSVFEGAGGLALHMMDLGTLTYKNKHATEPNLHDGRFPLYDF